MKILFEEPDIEVIRFSVEDAITTSGMRTGGGNPGFDEMEPNAYNSSFDPDRPCTWPMIMPCG